MLGSVRHILAALAVWGVQAIAFNANASDSRWVGTPAFTAGLGQNTPVLLAVVDSTPAELPSSAFSRALTNRFNPPAEEEASSASVLQQVLWTSLIAMCVLFVLKSGHRCLSLVRRYVPSWDKASAAVAGLSAQATAEQQELTDFAAFFRVGRSKDAASGAKDGSKKQEPSAPAAEPGFSFANGVSEIQAMNETFCRITTLSEEASRQQAIRALFGQASAFKDKTTAPQLLPLWQISAALEGLLKHLTTKSADVTPSTLKTTSDALDLLRE